MMNRLEEALARRALKPLVLEEGSGAIRLGFSLYHLLPEDAKPFLHLIDPAMHILPGVRSASADTASGRVEIAYDPALLTRADILHWFDTVVDEVMRYLRQLRHASDISEEGVRSTVLPALEKRLGGGK